MPVEKIKYILCGLALINVQPFILLNLKMTNGGGKFKDKGEPVDHSYFLQFMLMRSIATFGKSCMSGYTAAIPMALLQHNFGAEA